jgi:hypothetical protein
MKHGVQRGISVPTQHFLQGRGKLRKTLIELAGHTDANRLLGSSPILNSEALN